VWLSVQRPKVWLGQGIPLDLTVALAVIRLGPFLQVAREVAVPSEKAVHHFVPDFSDVGSGSEERKVSILRRGGWHRRSLWALALIVDRAPAFARQSESSEYVARRARLSSWLLHKAIWENLGGVRCDAR